MNTYAEALAWAANELTQTSQTPRLDAEVLLCAAAGISKVQLVAGLQDSLTEERRLVFEQRVLRRRAFEPVAYITGIKEFWGLEFIVNRSVLVPRPETELLVEKALEACAGCSGALSILDLGTGSGCIAVALGHELKKQGCAFKITAVDSSNAALEIARRNVEKFALADSIDLTKSNWFSKLSGQSFNVIVSNPPYVAAGDTSLSPELQFEPDFALFAGADGTEAIRFLLREAPGYLESKGCFLCEFGFGQRALLEKAFGDLQQKGFWQGGSAGFYQDLAGKDRVMRVCR